nr:EOG090X0181 [Triops cancriformis]
MALETGVLDKLTQNASKIRKPAPRDRVHKEECVFSFDNPESPEGLYVCLNTFWGLGSDHVERYYRKTDNSVFLNIRRTKTEVVEEKQEEGPEKKITRLAIGLEGGFPTDGGKKYVYQEAHKLVLWPEKLEILLPEPSLPAFIQESIDGVLSAESATKRQEIESLETTWDGEKRVISKYAADLKQLDNGVKIQPTGWQCVHCDKTENLWLNLTDGVILCGRRYFDGTGGNNHAVQHYEKTGFPLAVKLGTISSEGKADVYSYAEDDMVEDPYLEQHLLHFGINVAHLKKTDKSMAELEIDLNQRLGEWSTIQEAGSVLQPVGGPGLTGMVNLGNSCYLNSVVQVIFAIQDFQDKYAKQADAIFDQVSQDPSQDFTAQMAKLGTGLLSGRYSQPPEGKENYTGPGIKAIMFKALIGKGHPEFSTKRQQDAAEFFFHLVNMVDRACQKEGGENPNMCFKFQVEERLVCQSTHKVRYMHRAEYHLALVLPLDKATNQAEVQAYETKKAEAEQRGEKLKPEEIVRPKIPLQACLKVLVEPELLQQFYSTALKAKTTAIKTTRLATFPKILVVQLRKFTYGADWTPVKLDVAVEIPDVLDANFLRAQGPQAYEEMLPEDDGPAPVHFDDSILQSLTEMGFPLESCKKAAYFTENQGLEAATNWLMEHMADPDFEAPFVPPGVGRLAKKTTGDFVPDEEAVAMLEAMGFVRSQAVAALRNTDNNVERATDWIFSHPDEIAAAAEEPVTATAKKEFEDGPGKYELFAFVSHMGSSTHVGHYVCHMKVGGKWIIFNDEKVALSEHPPKELGYLYFYRRLSE